MTCFILVPLQLLPQIGNILANTYGGLGPGIELNIPSLSHHPLDLVNLPQKQSSPVPGVVTLPLSIS